MQKFVKFVTIKNEIKKKYRKVRDHCHYTGEYRIAYVHMCICA